ncbi:MAG: galactose oxidase-like domain-containing protein, partial [Terriglobales bacterium]
MTGIITQFTLAWDMFCNGMVVLQDGRAFINGGTLEENPNFTGSSQSAIFDPATNTFTDVQNMAHGRWYPTVLTLADGRVMSFSGIDENNNTNTTVEIYTVGSGWSSAYNAGWTPPLYPRMHLLPNGKVFFTGSDITTRLFDPANHSWTTLGNRVWNGQRVYGASVLLPLTPANNYDPKIITMGGGQYGPTATSETIDMGASNPAWQTGPNMSQQRVELNAVMLPNQKVLVLGGSSQDEVNSTASLNADIYDPVSNSFIWGGAGANSIPRLYHSMALLLPDATVWVAGSNPNYNVYEPRVEIYQPAYLFNSNGTAATRPAISSLPSTIAWGGGFTVSTPDAANISSVVLVRPGAPTHAFDTEQRLVGLTFTRGSGTLTVTAPPNGNIAPPGYYMLFLLNSSGVPSVAKFTKLSASGGNPPPTVASITPTSGSATGGNAVTIAGTGFLAGATVSLGGAAATGVTVVSSTSITATTSAHAAGAVNVVVTNTDSQSGTLSNGYTYTGTNPAPTVSAITPNSGTANGGTPGTITGTGFLTGATVEIGGTSASGVTLVGSTSITATTPAHAAGAVSVVVTNTDAQSGTLNNGYTYTTSTGGSITFVQVNAATPQTATTSLPVAYLAAQTAGNLNVVAVGWNDTTSTVSSVSDSRGNTYA